MGFLKAELQIYCLLTEPFKSDVLCRWTTSHEGPSSILSKDLISISPYCLSYNSYDGSLENLVLDQLKIPLLILSLFSSLVCLILYWYYISAKYYWVTPLLAGKCSWASCAPSSLVSHRYIILEKTWSNANYPSWKNLLLTSFQSVFYHIVIWCNSTRLVLSL